LLDELPELFIRGTVIVLFEAEGVGEHPFWRIPDVKEHCRAGVERTSTTWESILEHAAEVQADMIVVGSRGLSPVRSVLAASVSRAVVQHFEHPVLVVPSSRTAVSRGPSHRPRHAARAELGRALSITPRPE
jgi:hypothetical protein